MASGGVDYWKDHEWYDNAIAIFEFPTEKGLVQASYETLTTNSSNGYYELFMGDEGTLLISSLLVVVKFTVKAGWKRLSGIRGFRKIM